jgi:hypothetical protein
MIITLSNYLVLVFIHCSIFRKEHNISGTRSVYILRQNCAEVLVLQFGISCLCQTQLHKCFPIVASEILSSFQNIKQQTMSRKQVSPSTKM